MPVVDLLTVPPLGWVVRHEPWNAAPRRRFAAVRVTGSYRWLVGHAVLDEFGTLSSPVFVTPIPWLGKVYDAGMALALRRGSDLELDAGWPPLVAGIDVAPGPLPADWQAQMQRALESPFAAAAAPLPAAAPAVDADGRTPPAAPGPPATVPRRQSIWMGDHELVGVRIGEVALLATNAPLLPRQLGRLAEAMRAPCAIALATGNDLPRHEAGSLLELSTVSEAELWWMLGVAPGLVAPP